MKVKMLEETKKTAVKVSKTSKSGYSTAKGSGAGSQKDDDMDDFRAI